MIYQNLSVILIAHNEERIIADMIEGLIRDCSKEILELIVVDDASTDKTSEVVESLAAHDQRIRLIKRTPPCGVGRALKTGFSNVNPMAEYVLTMDSDFIESIKDVRPLIGKLEENIWDGVIGSRFIKGSQLSRYPWEKKLMNRIYHFLVRVVFRIKQKDLTNNFKLYKTKIIKTLPWRSDGYALNAETGILPIIAGYRIAEVPVWWVGRDSQMGKSKFRMFRSGWGYAGVILHAWRFSRLKEIDKGDRR